MSDGPGYAGDLFILQGGALSGDPPIMLVRNKENLEAIKSLLMKMKPML